jgi:hypothetical protein
LGALPVSPFWETVLATLFPLFGKVVEQLTLEELASESVQFALAALLAFASMEASSAVASEPRAPVQVSVTDFTPVLMSQTFSWSERAKIPEPLSNFVFADFFRSKTPAAAGGSTELRDKGLEQVAVFLVDIFAPFQTDGEKAAVLRNVVQDSSFWTFNSRPCQLVLFPLLAQADPSLRPLVHQAMLDECRSEAPGRTFPLDVLLSFVDATPDVPDVQLAAKYAAQILWGSMQIGDIKRFLLAMRARFGGDLLREIVLLAAVSTNGALSTCDRQAAREVLEILAGFGTDLSDDLRAMAASTELVAPPRLQSEFGRQQPHWNRTPDLTIASRRLKEARRFCSGIAEARAAAEGERVARLREFRTNEWVLERLREWRNPFRLLPGTAVDKKVRQAVFQARFELTADFCKAVASIGICTGKVRLFGRKGRQMVVYVPQKEVELVLLLRNMGLDAETFEGVPLLKFEKKVQIADSEVVAQLSPNFGIRITLSRREDAKTVQAWMTPAGDGAAFCHVVSLAPESQ